MSESHLVSTAPAREYLGQALHHSLGGCGEVDSLSASDSSLEQWGDQWGTLHGAPKKMRGHHLEHLHIEGMT